MFIPPIERSIKLRQEADFILQETGILEILSRRGKVTFTGSYSLDMMVYPDIDLYIPKVSQEELFRMGAEMAASSMVSQVVFEKGSLPSLPGGLYLKARVNYGNWGRPWKVDIWSIEPELIETRRSEIEHFQGKMTPELRKQIILYKDSLITSEHRTPMFSGYFIYKAFLDEGLRDPIQVTQYLVKQGIQVEHLPAPNQAQREMDGYEIWVEGHLKEGPSDLFDGMLVTNLEGGRAILSGLVADQAALHGLLARVRDMNLKLVGLRLK